MPAVDLYTGQTANQMSVNAYNQAFTQTQTTNPATVNTSGNQQTVSGGSQSGSSFQLNTTPDILANLQAFITQSMDHPAISQAELDRVAPLAVHQYDRNSGWYWVDPSTGRYFYNQADVTAFNNAQNAKRQDLIRQAGTVRGGTESQRAFEDARIQEIERSRTTQANYTKDAAFADAKALTGYFHRVLMEQQLPTIARAAEGSGTSQGSMNALLTSRAAEVTAEQAAKVGIDAASAYGNINLGFENVLEELTRGDPNGVVGQLLQALNIGKGIQTSGNTSSSGSQVSNTGSNQTQQTGGNTQTVTRTPTTGGPGVSPPPVLPPSDNFQLSPYSGSGYIIANPVIDSIVNTPSGINDTSGGIQFYGGDGQFIED